MKVYTSKAIMAGDGLFEYSETEKKLVIRSDNEVVYGIAEIRMSKKELSILIRGLVSIYKELS